MSKKIICEIWSRVCGFYRPTSQYNKSKKSEFNDRKTYSIKKFIDEKLKHEK